MMEMSMIYMGMSWFDVVYEIVIIRGKRTTSQQTNNSTISTISKSINQSQKTYDMDYYTSTATKYTIEDK